MALLSQMFRTVAITGRTDTVNAWLLRARAGAGPNRRFEMPSPGFSPATGPPADPDRTLRELMELHASGVLTDAELKNFRARLQV